MSRQGHKETERIKRVMAKMEINIMKTASFSAIWTDKLEAEIKRRSVEPYPMEFHYGSDDFESFKAAVAQGIDSHLEAIFFEQGNGMSGRLKFTVSADTLHVLIRRLMESGEENAESLASGICSTLEIELI